jgi:hypothetical protein
MITFESLAEWTHVAMLLGYSVGEPVDAEEMTSVLGLLDPDRRDGCVPGRGHRERVRPRALSASRS